MKKIAVILIVTALLPMSMLAQTWSGVTSSQLGLASNWGGNPPIGNTQEGDITIANNPGYPLTAGVARLPTVGTGDNVVFGMARVRGVGSPILTQTGGRLEFENGSGGVSKGLTIYTRNTGVLFGPVATYGPAASASNPSYMSVSGGTLVADELGVGTSRTGWNTAGTHTANTGPYAQDGWGKLELSGSSTLVIRPNKFVAPGSGAGYVETTPYWTFTGAPLVNRASRAFGVAIAPSSQIILNDNARMIVPLPIFAGEPDVVAILQWYQTQGRFVSGPGSNPINYEYFYGDGMQDGIAGGLLGGYAIVSVPEPGSIALLGLGLAGFLILRRRS